ncbi:MAG: hypothetical protein HFI19_15495 [Lachnospiraceae bacterium]|nr:hypothetical protein [Lachnospiraceae bacterium]
MNSEMLLGAYESWTESENYKFESAIEQVSSDEQEKIFTELSEKKDIDAILNYAGTIMVESERRGFEKGFCLGALFVIDVVKGGIL